MSQEFESVEAILDKYIPENERAQVKQVLYGQSVTELKLSDDAKKLAEKAKFELKGFTIDAKEEQTRPKRLVRIAAIQNKSKS